jgi:hypothetical protein
LKSAILKSFEGSFSPADPLLAVATPETECKSTLDFLANTVGYGVIVSLLAVSRQRMASIVAGDRSRSRGGDRKIGFSGNWSHPKWKKSAN